jgi:hypothetical protein
MLDIRSRQRCGYADRAFILGDPLTRSQRLSKVQVQVSKAVKVTAAGKQF